MRTRLSVLVLAALASTSCLSSSTLIRLGPDGTGTVVQTTRITADGLAQMNALRDLATPRDGSLAPAPDLFSAEQAKAKATRMGEGVSFLSSRKLETGEGEGLEAIYAFSDVTTLRLSDRPEPPFASGGGIAPRRGSEPFVFRLERLSDGNARVSIAVPRGEPPPKEPKPTTSPPEEVLSKQVAQMKSLFQGLAVRVAVEVPRLVRTNSPYVSGTTVTLLEMDFEALLANEAKLEELAANHTRTFEEAKQLLRGVPGFKISPDSEVVIELARP